MEVSMIKVLKEIKHPLVQHKLSLMRKKGTSTRSFRVLAREVGLLLAYEVTQDLPLEYEEIETPLQKMQAPFLEGKKLCLVPILRAGIGLLDGFLELIPSARVGHIGLYRDPVTLAAVEYYLKLPEMIDQRLVIALDPMLATGHSSAAAVSRLKENGASNIRFVSLLAAPEGIEYFHSEHPDVPIYTAAVDEKLNDHAYILPGLGDAGDRIFGTK
ncbi:MAG: uracil phosphoribosyltransferase [Deltaproteobacteria bacterium]